MNISSESSPPPGWTWTTLGEISVLVRGVSYPKEEASTESKDGYLPILRANNINGELNTDKLVYVPSTRVSEEQYVLQGDIVIAMSSGSKDLVGKAAQAQVPFAGGFGAFCGLVRLTDQLEPRYVGYFFQSQGRLTEEWRKNRRHGERSRTMTSSFDSAQDDVSYGMAAEPAVAYSVGDAVAYEPASVLLVRIREENRKALGKKYKERASLDTSSLPQLPEGWAWARLNKLCVAQGGFAFKSVDYQESGVPLLRIPNIVDGKVSFDADTVYLADAFLAEYSGFVLKRGDIVIALSGATTGKSAFEGKLMEQDATDESAEKLMERIKTARERRALEQRSMGENARKTGRGQR